MIMIIIQVLLLQQSLPTVGSSAGYHLHHDFLPRCGAVYSYFYHYASPWARSDVMLTRLLLLCYYFHRYHYFIIFIWLA